MPDDTRSRSDLAFARLGAMPLRGVDVTSLDEQTLRRLHELTIVLCAVLVVGPIQAVRYATLGVWPIVGSIVAGSLLMLGNLWLLRRTRSPALVGGVGVAILFMQLLVNVVASGGFHDPMFSWLYVLPVATALMVGPRATWLVTAAVAAVAAAMWQLHESGFILLNTLPEAVQASQSLVNRVSALSTIGVLLAASHAQRSYLMSRLEHANARLADETHTQRELRARALTAQREAELANGAKTRFLTNLSHELRTPLNTIMGYSELVIEEQEDELGQVSKDIRHILGAAVDLSRLFETLFFLTSLESDSLKVQATRIELTELVSELVSEFEGRAQAKGLDLEIVCHDAPQLESDRVLLGHLLRGLLDNAVKYTVEGRVRVEVAHDASTHELCVIIEDTGEGMSPEVKERALEPFTQAEVFYERVHDGLGLGLSLCARITELLDARLALDTQPGRGTTARVSFPSAPGA